MQNLIGQRLGQYTITAKLGSGGMATVYRAQQANVERTVAVKVIKTELAENSEFVERFKREARTVANLSHPHILKLFDFGIQADLLYLVMELHEGGSLAERLKAQAKLDAEDVAKYLEQVGAALDHAHNRGVIHRDLKPQNVLLDSDGNAILTDFGIVRITGDMTASGIAMDTPAYMAPEQWHGRAVDARTDIYALAVMTYELLTGHLPFTGDTPPALMYQHLNEPPPPLRQTRPDLPRSVEAVLLKGMAKRPEVRFQSASAFARAFREALSGKTPPGVDIAETQRPLTPQTRTPRRLLIGIAALTVIALSVLIVLLLTERLSTSVQSETPFEPIVATAQAVSTSIAASIPTQATYETATAVMPTVLPPAVAAERTIVAAQTVNALTAAPSLTQAAHQTATAADAATATAYQAQDADGNAHPNNSNSCNSHADAHTDANAHLHAEPHTDSNSHADAHTDSNSYTDAHLHADAHADGNSHANAHLHAEPHTDGNSHLHADAHTDSHTGAHQRRKC